MPNVKCLAALPTANLLFFDNIISTDMSQLGPTTSTSLQDLKSSVISVTPTLQFLVISSLISCLKNKLSLVPILCQMNPFNTVTPFL